MVGKGKVHPGTGHEDPEGKQMYSPTLPSTLALDRGGCSMPRPGSFTRGKDPVSIVLEAGWATGPVWMGMENLTPTRIRSSNHTARGESLCRLSYHGPRYGCYWVITLLGWYMGISSAEEHLKGRSAAGCCKILYPSPRLHGVQMHKGTSDLKIETLYIFEMLVSVYQAAWYCNSEDNIVIVIDEHEFRRKRTPQQKGMWTKVHSFRFQCPVDRKYCVYVNCYATDTAICCRRVQDVGKKWH